MLRFAKIAIKVRNFNMNSNISQISPRLYDILSSITLELLVCLPSGFGLQYLIGVRVIILALEIDTMQKNRHACDIFRNLNVLNSTKHLKNGVLMAWDAKKTTIACCNGQRCSSTVACLLENPSNLTWVSFIVSKEVLKCAQIYQDYKFCNQKSAISIWT